MKQSQLLMGALSTQNIVLGNLVGSSLAVEISALKKTCKKPLVVICSDSHSVLRLESELAYLCPDEQILAFRDYETLPYDQLSPQQEVISSRIQFLASAPYLSKGIILTSINAIMQKLCPTDHILTNSFTIAKGDQRDLTQLCLDLTQQGYMQVEQVLSHGEFAVRGFILDVFPMGLDDPLRIEFLDDEVDNLSYFNLQTQRTFKQVENVRLLPGNEFPLDSANISSFRMNYHSAFSNESYNVTLNTVYKSISQRIVPAGIEYYLPLFFDHTSSFFDYINDRCAFVLTGDFDHALDEHLHHIEQRYNATRFYKDHPPLPVKEVFFSPDDIRSSLQGKERITLNSLINDQSGDQSFNAPCAMVPNIAFNHRLKNRAEPFYNFVEDFCAQKHGRILISTISEGRRQTLIELIPIDLIQKYGFNHALNMDDFLKSSDPVMMTIAPYDEGVIYDKSSAIDYIKEKNPDQIDFKFVEQEELDCPLAILTETELLGFKVLNQRKRNSRARRLDPDTIIRNLAELKEGQLVVHIDHGIGIYRGLKAEVLNGVKGEYLSIEYLNGSLSIPITALNKVARYVGEENPDISSLGNDTWSKRKQKAALKVSDVAAELLDLYAKRELRKGFAFKVDELALKEFNSGFPYVETEDQLKAIEQTLADMQKPVSMDRLICGDVGFGKTEVALRAAFVAASNGKQVAVLTPTTILSEQHYQNFKDRFANTAINVDLLSRFKTVKQKSQTLDKVANGQVDIIIGTHALLSKKVVFKDLGLLIVDEEHRFGVKQKEKLKALCSDVDLLTLTATPIPRTLNMTLEGMRELSIIATPPEHRLPVKTFIYRESDEICREAIMRELRRGGQVYYLHNNVTTMALKANELSKIVPEAKIEIAHGQMREQDLQTVMHDFYRQRFNVLLCSTIIENGLDIPSANTIIIDRADKLGLAQLHQIRGRVGRSHHQAYAYFFTPHKNLLTKEAKMRLQAIAEIGELGAGFVLASHDLEIRGAGEFLGEEQSGQIQLIGFSLYMDMLNAAVNALREGREPTLNELSLNECEIDLRIPALFPDDYIRDVTTRLSLYKRIASCTDDESFADLKIELIDRFGKLPPESENLFAISKLKRLGSRLGISKIRGDHTGALIDFEPHHKVDTRYLALLVSKSQHNEYRITRENSIRYNLPESQKNSRITILKLVLNAFYAHSSLKAKDEAKLNGSTSTSTTKKAKAQKAHK